MGGSSPAAARGSTARLRAPLGFAGALAEAVRLHRSGDLSAAERLYEAALELWPDEPRCLHLLGILCFQQGRCEQAADRFAAAAAADPADAQIHCDLGHALRRLGDCEAAVEAYRTSIGLQGDNPEARQGMGRALLCQDRPAAAVGPLRAAAKTMPDNAAAHSDLGEAFQRLGRHAQAAACFERAISLQPDDARAHARLAGALLKVGRYAEAAARAQQAAAIDGALAEPHMVFAHLHRRMGEFAGAQACCRRALQCDADHPGALLMLSLILGASLPAEELAALRRLARSGPDLGDYDRATVHAALAAALDPRGEYADAAAHSRLANAAQRSDHLRTRGPGTMAGGARRAAPLIEAFDSAYFRRVAGWGLDTHTPVFVVGLPRSGTTLAERILASHPRVHSGGELPFLRDSWRALPQRVGRRGRCVDCLPHLTFGAVDELAHQHLDRLARLDPAAARIVSKTPDNYLLLGLLVTLFPKARIIHMTRGLRDVAVSCWMTFFESVAWACDMQAIGERMRSYLAVMAHWRRVLPAPILEVSYERLVTDLETEARRLIEWVDLPWEPRCLEFHKSGGPVDSASFRQVREPVYTRSVGRWRNYEHHLADLFEHVPQADRGQL